MTSIERVEEGLVRLCRAGIGDTLRCVVHVAPGTTSVLYLRRDLVDGERGRSPELERALAVDHASEPPPSAGELTVRPGEVTVAVFEMSGHEVRLTSDEHRGGDCDFEDIAPAVTGILQLVERPVPAGR
jgi:hypothetical protein